MLDPLEDLIPRVPFFRTLDHIDIARLMGSLEQVEFPAGTLIFAEDAEADALYLLEEGRVIISVATASGERWLTEIEGPSHFGDLGLLLARRTGSARALTDVRAWKLPRHRFEQLVRERPGIAIAVAASLADLVDRRTREHVGAPPKPRTPVTLQPPPVARSRLWRMFGAAVSIGVPVILWPLAPPADLGQQGWHVAVILLGAALAWFFEPVPDFVVALAMVAAWGVAGLVPPSLAFAGFVSPSWLVAVGALGLAAAMARSGLLFRIALFLLRIFPATHVGQVLALLVGGFLLTPLVPLGIARVATIAPLAQELAQGLGYPRRSRASAALSFAGLLGYGAFSSIFLTGLAMNFFVFDLLPSPERVRFTWVTWFMSAIPAGAVMFAGAALLLLILLRPEVQPRTTVEMLRRQERVLGHLSRYELVTIAALAVLLIGLLLQPLLHIDAAWLALAALVLVMAGNVLDRERFRGSIEWGFLILFGVLLGTGGVLRSAGVQRWIAGAVVPFAAGVGGQSALIVLLSLFVVACRLVLPWIPATLLLSLALVPASEQMGLSPWIVGFVVLVAANTWLHPNQSDFYRLTREATEGTMFTERHGIIVGVAMTLSTVLALAVSIPYWRAIGLLAP